MFISDTIRYIGVNDHEIDLFEAQYAVPNGMAYNSYAILDKQIAIMDSVEVHFTEEWLENIRKALGERQPDYLIVQHMEPDHSGSILSFIEAYPKAKIVASARAFTMLKNFFGITFEDRQIVAGDRDTLSLGTRTLTFFTAAMLHWPEVIMTYDSQDRVFFSADAFGKFGALDIEEDWVNEARRYYIGIVGKYGGPVQTLLKKAAALDIQVICPLHGPVLSDHLNYYRNFYNTWSTYAPEEDGVVIAYTSIYGNTRKAVEQLAKLLYEKGDRTVVLHDLARCDMSQAVADAFRYSKLVLATTTYNGGVFPFMGEFIHHLSERCFRNRTVAFIENGSWAPAATRTMKGMLEKCEGLIYTDATVKILSALDEVSSAQLASLAEELCRESADKTESIEEKTVSYANKKYACTLCGYIYEGSQLPSDFVCPLCKRGTEFFEEIT